MWLYICLIICCMYLHTSDHQCRNSFFIHAISALWIHIVSIMKPIVKLELCSPANHEFSMGFSMDYPIIPENLSFSVIFPGFPWILPEIPGDFVTKIPHWTKAIPSATRPHQVPWEFPAAALYTWWNLQCASEKLTNAAFLLKPFYFGPNEAEVYTLYTVYIYNLIYNYI